MARLATTSTLAQSPVIAALCVTTVMFLVGCSGDESKAPDDADATNSLASPETPAEAIASIIALFEARDFDALFRTRYAEIGKAENEEQIQILIDRHTSRFEDDDALNEAIVTYMSALELTPILTEDGTVATFRLDNGFIKLSKMSDGLWGFHL